MQNQPKPVPLNELKEYWLNRVRIATERHKTAAAQYREALDVYREKQIPSPDGNHSFRQAVIQENAARREYLRVLQIFTDLVLEGKLPEHTE